MQAEAVALSLFNSNKPSGSIKGGELFDKLNDSQLLLHDISYIIYIYIYIKP